MNCKISFQERAKLATELLSKQSPVTLEQARQQAQWLKKISATNRKKQTRLYGVANCGIQMSPTKLF